MSAKPVVWNRGLPAALGADHGKAGCHPKTHREQISTLLPIKKYTVEQVQVSEQWSLFLVQALCDRLSCHPTLVLIGNKLNHFPQAQVCFAHSRNW